MNGERVAILHGGGPTAVLNASLYGVLTEAARHSEIEAVYGAWGGTGGALKDRWIDLTAIPLKQLQQLPFSPASAIGTSRDPLDAEAYERLVAALQKQGITIALMNGGNGTMDACGKLAKAGRRAGIRVMGIPKTMDNDIAVTDHSPGFGSVARYMAGTVSELCADVHSLPIHVVVLEALGRNAGWTTAAAALAGDGFAPGPDLLYVPEVPFSEERFLEDVTQKLKKKRGLVVVASEGLCGEDGKPIVSPVFQSGRATYFGDVSAHLAGLVIQKLGYKARSEKPGIVARASIAWQSPVDREEAARVGAEALKAALSGQSGQMVALERVSDEPYESRCFLTPVEKVMLTERKLPLEYLNSERNGVSQAFLRWCRPLIGPPIPNLVTFQPD